MRYDHTPLEELGKTRRPRKVRVPLATPVQEKFKSMSKTDQSHAVILYKKFIMISDVPLPKEWLTLDVKMEWAMQLLEMYKEELEVDDKTPTFTPFLEWLVNNAHWMKEIWIFYKGGRHNPNSKGQRFKNPCDKFCKEIRWMLMEYNAARRIQDIREREALVKAEQGKSSRREYLLPKIEDHPEIELPDDLEESECYLVRGFGGEIEVRVKPKGERMAGRHNPQTGVRDI